MKRHPRALTVVELAATLSVLATVVAIAFVGLRSYVSYQDDQVAKGYLATVRDLQRRYAALNDSFTSSPTDLSGVPIGLTVTSAESLSKGTVSMAVGSSGSLGLATMATSGTCYTLRLPPLSGSTASVEQTEATLPTTSTCDGRSALPPGEWALPPGAPSDTPMYLLSAAFSSGNQTLSNQGRALSALDAQLGSAPTSDGNDPLWLPYAGETYAYLPGVAGNGFSTADSAATSPTGSFDIRMRLAATSWTPSTDRVLTAKWGASGQRSYRFMLTSSGALQLVVSSDGAATSLTSTSSSAVSFAAQQSGWVRVTYTAVSATTASVAFYQGSDGTNWTALNTPSTVSVSSSAVRDSSATTKVGLADDVSYDAFQGSVYASTYADGTGSIWLDLATSTCTQTTCAGASAASWSVLRATAPASQTAVVDRSMFLIQNTTWLQVGANAYLDLPASMDATIVVAGRWHGGPASGTPQVVSHRDQVSSSVCGTGGWSIHQTSAATPAFQTVLSTGSACQTANLTLTDHQPGVLGILRSGAGTSVSSFAGSQLVDFQTKYGTTSVPAANVYQSTYPLRVGLLGSGSGVAGDQPGSFEFFGIAVYSRALSDAEIVSVARMLGA